MLIRTDQSDPNSLLGLNIEIIYQFLKSVGKKKKRLRVKVVVLVGPHSAPQHPILHSFTCLLQFFTSKNHNHAIFFNLQECGNTDQDRLLLQCSKTTSFPGWFTWWWHDSTNNNDQNWPHYWCGPDIDNS